MLRTAALVLAALMLLGLIRLTAAFFVPPFLQFAAGPRASLDGNTPDQAYFNPLPIRMAA